MAKKWNLPLWAVSFIHLLADVIDIALALVEVRATNRELVVITRLIRLVGIVVPVSIVLIQSWLRRQIPGAENLYDSAWWIILVGAYALVGLFIVGWRYRYKLDQHPTVEIAETPIQDGAQYYVPVKNCGPGNVKVWVTAKDIEFDHGKGRLTSPGPFPVKFVRWYRGSGSQAIDTPNGKMICEHGEWRLYLLNLDHTTDFDNQRARSGDIQAANAGENCNLVALPGSKVRITLQAFGEPILCKETTQTVEIEMPSFPTQPDKQE